MDVELKYHISEVVTWQHLRSEIYPEAQVQALTG
jgi:hypothetical protein